MDEGGGRLARVTVGDTGTEGEHHAARDAMRLVFVLRRQPRLRTSQGKRDRLGRLACYGHSYTVRINSIRLRLRSKRCLKDLRRAEYDAVEHAAACSATMSSDSSMRTTIRVHGLAGPS